MTTSAIEPIERTITVLCGREHAFATFTESMAAWWPVHSHSVGDEKVKDIVIEPRVGGRVFELWDDGHEHPWGEVLAWDPPSRFAMTWHPSSTAEAATEVEVVFEAHATALTRVRLIHRGWEALGDLAREKWGEYEAGWPGVLSHYVRHAVDVEIHRTLAKATNQEVWSLLGNESRTEAEDRRMLSAAHASLYHWLIAGGPTEEQRGEWLVSHVHAVLGHGGEALRHAERCMALTSEAGLGDFDLGYALEGMARAHAVSGHAAEAEAWKARAAGAAAGIAEEEDREWFEKDLEAGPWGPVPTSP